MTDYNEFFDLRLRDEQAVERVGVMTRESRGNTRVREPNQNKPDTPVRRYGQAQAKISRTTVLRATPAPTLCCAAKLPQPTLKEPASRCRRSHP
jgi:hypothetical protein